MTRKTIEKHIEPIDLTIRSELTKRVDKLKSGKPTGEELHGTLIDFEKVIKHFSKNRRINATETTILEQIEFMKGLSFLYEEKTSGEINQRIANKKDELKNLSTLTKGELCKKIYELEVRLDFSKEFSKNLADSFGYLLTHFQETRFKKLKAVKHRTDKKNKKYEDNNGYLMKCLKEAIPESKTEIDPNDFLKFQAIAKKNPPAFIQKTRRSKQDRMMSEEIQRLDAEALARNEWAPSTLRNFFEKHTGVKPSSIRK